MLSTMLMMISPAKKLDVETPAPVSAFTVPEFLDASQELVNSLRMLSAEEFGGLMKISPKLADLNMRRYRYWHTPFTPENAKQALSGEAEPVLINLASNEYSKAVSFPLLIGRVINVQFREQKDDGYKIIGIHAKKARGLMSRFVIQNRIDTSEDIKQFNQADYRYRADMSAESDWVFAR